MYKMMGRFTGSKKQEGAKAKIERLEAKLIEAEQKKAKEVQEAVEEAVKTTRDEERETVAQVESLHSSKMK